MSSPPYGPEHPRYEYAKRFGVEMRAAMAARGVRQFQVFKATGGGFSNLVFHSWMAGTTLPRLDRTVRIAEYLSWPALVEIVREARSGACQRRGCDNTFITEGGKTRKYCSPRCRQLTHDYDLRYTHASRKKVAGTAAEVGRLSKELQVAQEVVGEVRRAVASMCGQCEPSGSCRMADCPLRPISPLPLARPELPSVDLATRTSAATRRRAADYQRRRRANSAAAEATSAAGSVRGAL